MGDIIEITTRARQPVSFYRVTASGINFELKAQTAALVGLAKEPGDSCQYWCGFVQGGRVWIKGPEGIKTGTGGNYTLTENEFQKFWVAWDCGVVRLGKNQEMVGMLSYPKDGVKLKYVTFTTHDARFPTTWRIQLPPASLIKVRNSVPCKQIKGGELRWESAEYQLPDDAVIGGFEGETVYIIRGMHRGSQTPGKFVPSDGVGYIPWGGAAHMICDVEVLCGFNHLWVSTTDDHIPTNAFVAGYSEGNHEKLYIGRAKHMNFVVPGKVQPSHKVCYIPFGDNEHPFREYEILTVPELDLYSAGVYLESNVIVDPVEAVQPPRQFYNRGFPNHRRRRNYDDEDDDEDDEEGN